MGAQFSAHSPAVRQIHERTIGAVGMASVRSGSWAGRLISRFFGLPRASADVPLEVRFVSQHGREIWTPDFGGQVFSSSLDCEDGLLVERFGPFAFSFSLETHCGDLAMRLRRWRIGDLRLPLIVAPKIEA